MLDTNSERAGSNYEQLAHRAHLFLERQGGHASEEALIREVFNVRVGNKPEVWGGILMQVLSDPQRFRRTPGGEWHLAVQTDTTSPLFDLEYVVIDCETTGLHPQRQRVIEVAAIRLRGGKRVETFQTLINPHRRIPDYISKFTGITSEMTATAPGFGRIVDQLRQFIGSAIIVGHNIPFDIRFLDYELRRLALPPLLNETIDTITLALRLHPGMKRPNLDRLAALCNLPVSNRHRAYGDASITADAFLVLLQQAADKGYTTLADLRAGRPKQAISNQLSVVSLEEEEIIEVRAESKAQSVTMFEMPLPQETEPEPEEDLSDQEDETADENATPERPDHLPRKRRQRWDVTTLTNRATARARHVLSKELIRDLPEKPGVYLMKDALDKVIYVGKAKNLRDRVSSYYSQPLGYTRKMDGLVESIAKIDHIVVGSELEALLLESKLIKYYLPRYNSQQRNYESYPFIKIDLSQRFPRIYSCREVSDDGARYFGPFKSRRAVETTVEIIQQLFPVRTCGYSFEWVTLNRKKRPDKPCARLSMNRCPGPCTGKHGEEDHAEYMQIIEEIISFLSGEKEGMLDKLWQQLQRASQSQNFERATAIRDAYQQVEKIIGSQKFLAAAVEGNNVLIGLPSAEEGAFEILCIYRGRLGRQVRFNLSEGSSGSSRIKAAATTLETIWNELIARETELAASQPGWGKRGGRVIGKEAVDEINIIARWLYTHSDQPNASDRAIVSVPGSPSAVFWENALTQIQTSLRSTETPQEANPVGQ
jgi:DNA polymerase III epsilon subunit family exonuclease